MVSNNPWKGLESYKYADANHFYGRDQELNELAEIIRQNSFTTIYGISGAGKTSIINAGLCPLLDKEQYLPVYIRLNHGKDRVSYDQQIINATEAALSKIEGEAEKSYDIDIESEFDQLWLYFHSHTFWTKDNHKISPILFIDQFEEIFTKNDDVNDIWSFFNVIDSLQYNMPTERILSLIQNANKSITFGDEANFRVVFSMREDFLPRLEDYCFDIPAMRRNRVGLKSLNGLQAIEVITKPCPDIVTKEVALHIISKVVGKKVSDNTRKLEATLVDTSILSLFCTELYNYRDESKDGGAITKSLVDLYGGNILEWFYDRNMQVLPKRTYIYLEDHLLTHSGFRNSVAIDDLLENNVTQEQIDRLEENRIIRVEDINHTRRVEFTHDVLCKIAKKRKDERDSLTKAKDEATARRMFTFDTTVFMSFIALVFTDFFYISYNTYIFPFLQSVPLLFFIYMIFIHRSLSDKNFSILLGIVFGGLGLGGVLSYMLGDVCYAVGILGIGYKMIILTPFIIIPLVYCIYRNITSKLTTKKQLLLVSAIYVIIPIAEILLGICAINLKTTMILALTIILSPLILLFASPFVFLFKKHSSCKKLNIIVSFYVGYLIIVAVLELINLIFSNEIDTARKMHIAMQAEENSRVIFENVIFFIGFVIIVLSTLYFSAYIRQEKELTIQKYIDNVLDFQSIKKYNSFSIRLKTICIFFIVFVSFILGMTYIDIIPFITLPITSILLLYSISKEIKYTGKKNIFSPIFICLVTIGTTCELLLQYWCSIFSYALTIVIGSLFVICITFYFCHTENFKTNKLLVFRLSLYAFLISFLLPILCVGYNLYNPQLSNVARVWGGRIISNQIGINFLTIQDELGNKGVMDNTEIIIEPQFRNIFSQACISSDIYSDSYPTAYNIYSMLSLTFIDLTGDYNDYSLDKMEFLCSNYKGDKIVYDYYSFLSSKNKFGKKITDEKLENCTDKYIENVIDSVGYSTSNDYTQWWEVVRVLSNQNRNIGEKEREYALTRIFINDLFKVGYERWSYDKSKTRNNFYNKDAYFSQDVESNEITSLFNLCFEEASISPLLTYKGKLINAAQISSTIKRLYPIFALDVNHYVSNAIFNQLCGRYSCKLDNPDFAYYLLFTRPRDIKRIRSIAQSNVHKNTYNGLQTKSNLCIIDYYINDENDFISVIKSVVKELDNNKSARNGFMYELVLRAEELNFWGVKKLMPELLDKASLLLGTTKYSKKGAGGEIYATEAMKNSTNFQEANYLNDLAYAYANNYNYSLAMDAIDRAISLCPTDANLYDTKGELYLMQGDEYNAVEMWEKVINLDPQFVEHYPKSKLYSILVERSLI